MASKLFFFAASHLSGASAEDAVALPPLPCHGYHCHGKQFGKGPIVETEHGKVEGFNNAKLLPVPKKATVEGFQGIPYAAPPVGNNRFRSPQPVKPWAPATRSAKKLGNICMQVGLDVLKREVNGYVGDEDCLYLNVYRPVGVKEGNDVPVVVWIHGGGYIVGDSMNFAGGKFLLYDPENIVERHGHVYVAMNYRMSGLGFLALPELAGEHATGSTGNYALQDQRAALQWVKRNIQSFGGDAGKVTIQGESAGGISVMAHLVSPASRGLFHAAIEESGSIARGWFYQNKTDSFKFSQQWAAIQGCKETGAELLACLRKLPASSFVVGAPQFVRDWAARRFHKPLPAEIPDWASPIFPACPWGNTIDGSPDGLPDWPDTLLDAGKFEKVPLISGSNLNGGSLLGWTLPLLWGDLMYPLQKTDITKVAKWFLRQPSDRAKFLQLYGGDDWQPLKHYKTVWGIERIDRFFRDYLFTCPNREIASAFSKHGTPVYEYMFSFDTHTNFTRMTHDLSASHAFELPFVFRNSQKLGWKVAEPMAWRRMTDIMSCTWASFIKCQKPKCPGSPPPNCEDVLAKVPEWPEWKESDRRYISFKRHNTIETFPEHATFPNDERPGDDRCDFWKQADMSWQGIRRYPDDPPHNPTQEAATEAVVLV